MGIDSWNRLPLNLELYSSKDIIALLFSLNDLLYSFLNLVVGPLSVYVCALNRTFLLVGW